MLPRKLFYLLTALLMTLTHVTSHADCEKYLSTTTPNGSPIDIEILQALLQLDKLIPLPKLDPDLKHESRRPRSPYLMATESLASVFDYLNNSPSALTVTRVEDLNYLRHVIAIAKMTPDADRQAVMSRAQREWHLARLSAFPNVSKDFLAWENERPILKLIAQVEKKIDGWTETPGLSLNEKALRSSTAKKAKAKLKVISSAFDLYLIEKYLHLIIEKEVSEKRAQQELDHHLQLTDWRNFSSNFGRGSFDFVVDFADAASHDTELKAFLGSILIKMEQSKLSQQNQDFNMAFESSRWHVESQIEDIPEPEQYESNLSVFMLKGKRDLSNKLSEPFIAEVQVQWNRKLGRLEAWLGESIPLKKDLRVKNHRRLSKFLEGYFDYFRGKNSYTEKEIDHHLEYEAQASLARNTYVIFTRPGFPDDAVAMVKIFNGAPLEFKDPKLQEKINQPSEMRSSIESMFPHLTLEERKQGVPILEIGRMIAHPHEAKPQAFSILMARIADLLYSVGARGMTYFYGVERVKSHHTREGAEVVFTPDDLALPANTEPKWIMRMPVKDMTARYFSRIFEAVRLRRPPPQYLVDGPTPDMIHAHVKFDLPNDIHAEAVILNNEDGEPSLMITHRNGDDVRHEIIMDNANLGLVTQGFAGTESSLEVSGGRLIIHQQNTSVGRQRWERSLEVDFIDGEYIVTRFTYSHRDTINTRIGGSCDYHLLTGIGEKDGSPVTIAKTKISLKNLADHEALHSCSGW